MIKKIEINYFFNLDLLFCCEDSIICSNTIRRVKIVVLTFWEMSLVSKLLKPYQLLPSSAQASSSTWGWVSLSCSRSSHPPPPTPTPHPGKSLAQPNQGKDKTKLDYCTNSSWLTKLHLTKPQLNLSLALLSPSLFVYILNPLSYLYNLF
jgi:hypothetical protein